jgi:hypothetical protein
VSNSGSSASESAGEHLNRGVALYQSGQREAAVAAFSQALSLDPQGRYAAQALSNRGVLLAELHRLDEALPDTQRAVDLQPRNVAFLCNHAIVLGRHQRYADALPLLRRAVSLKPGDAYAHALLGLTLLNLGELAEGFKESEWRVREPRGRQLAPRTWDGSPLDGEAVFLRSEQGLGDTIQFVRYAPLLREQRGGRVLLECQPRLKSLMQTVPGVEAVYGTDEPTPSADFEIGVMSLPDRFATTLDTIPRRVPYVSPDPQRAARLRPLLTQAKGFKVGLNWAGNPDSPLDATRSTTLATLRDLLKVPGVAWVSLQKGPGQARDAALIRELGLMDIEQHCTDMADTAAAMSLLDLIITTDTAPAHLAGALGRPTWVMLEYYPEWRWGRQRSDCPWYPTMRLFRQKSLGNWGTVVEQVAAALADRVNSPAL